MDNLTQNDKVTADTAEAENGNAAAVLGKFKDVQTLIKAYSDLEAEFTRRSQRLKELEKENKAQLLPDGVKGEPSHEQLQEEVVANAINNPKVRDAVIGDYLKSIAAAGSVALTSGGGGVPAPRQTPKTVKEAGRLAKEFLKG